MQDKLAERDPGWRYQVVNIYCLLRLRLLALFCTGLAFTAAAASSEAQFLPGRPLPRRSTIEILDVGQGDSILIRSPEGKTALIDAGPTRDAALSSPAKARGSSRSTWWRSAIIIAIITAAWMQVVRAMKPRYFLASRSGHSTTLYLKLLKTVEAQGMTVIQPTSHARKIELGSDRAHDLPPAPRRPTRTKTTTRSACG